jgi:large subunit ribosomal protein L3
MAVLIGKKIGMTQIFDEDGNAVPVTVLEVGPCRVVQIRTAEKDGYTAIQLGYQETKEKRLTKPELGHLKKWNAPPLRVLKEFRVDPGDHKPGDVLKVDGFEVGELVDVVGRSKGRGFQGVVKRHGFSGGPETHGAKTHDEPGSLGASAFPSRVIKGKKLPGHMGTHRVTVKNLKVVAIDAERNLLLVRGAVPGPRNGIVYVRSTGRKAKR